MLSHPLNLHRGGRSYRLILFVHSAAPRVFRSSSSGAYCRPRARSMKTQIDSLYRQHCARGMTSSAVYPTKSCLTQIWEQDRSRNRSARYPVSKCQRQMVYLAPNSPRQRGWPTEKLYSSCSPPPAQHNTQSLLIPATYFLIKGSGTQVGPLVESCVEGLRWAVRDVSGKPVTSNGAHFFKLACLNSH
jgi:hypothetical protein